MKRSAAFLSIALLMAVSGCVDRHGPAMAADTSPSGDTRPLHDLTGSKPNIILILADDMGWSDLGAYGSEIATPNLDRLAREGLQFTQFTNTSKCFPSRASLMTGLYPQQVGKDKSSNTRMIGGTTFAESLRRAGYHTYMVGKHHGSENPIERGFDHYVGLRDGAGNYFNPGTKARPGEPEPARKEKDGRVWCFEGKCAKGYTPDDPNFYTTDAFTDWTIDYLREATADKAPYLLYLAYTAPHDPLQAPDEARAPYRGKFDGGYARIADKRWANLRRLKLVDDRYPRPTAVYRDWNKMTAAEKADQTARMEIYAAMIHRLDEQVGRIVAFLEANGTLDDTLILFMSDNGSSAELVTKGKTGREIGADNPIGSVGRWASLGPDWAEVSNTPFRYYKNDSYQGGTASPLIVHWPRALGSKNRRVEALSNLIDIHPTLLDLAGLSYIPTADATGRAAPLPGISLVPLLEGSPTVSRPRPIFNRWRWSRSVRDGDWKLVSIVPQGEAEDGTWELYNIATDRTETHDLAAAHPEIVARLDRAYNDWLKEVSSRKP
ncbi:arylsulfatase [Hephaestia caeni]|uniref:Arylsulfatase n=1 Tax=Hephaestia caeni TaxID=645617 RepID=A0A397PES8_9SPHN|nr:arylsulfatase [Hephaestia caeni]RIA46933.1 arylsulfatase [Hephaestia caeni]